jgi:hypothetical protein
MARESVNQLIDFDNREIKRRFVGFVGALTGIYSVALKPRRATRSLRANAAYFVTVVHPFYQYLRQQEYNVTCLLQAHEILKAECNMVDVYSPKTGEIIAKRPGDTHDLDDEAFSAYWERTRVYLWDRYAIVTEDPEPVPANRVRRREPASAGR